MTKIRRMTRCAMLSGLLTVCAWISIPLPPVSFTMQTFALCLTLELLGGKWGSVTVLTYLLLGAVGLPVFAGFRGGPGVLVGPTGGFLWGFLLAGAVYGPVRRLGKLPAMGAALGVCYLAGCLWYTVYAPGTGLWAAFTLCAAPYLLPEAVKVGLAWSVSKKLGRYGMP